MYERVFETCYSFDISSEYINVFGIDIVHIKITVSTLTNETVILITKLI
jgi:hypothetical protein